MTAPRKDRIAQLADTIKQACRHAALEAYEDALIRGLCAQGAFEVAMAAIQSSNVNDSLDELGIAMKSHVAATNIRIKRIYEAPSKDDGLRILVDRIWPRGVAKQSAHLDDWLKDLAPSTELRKWYGHDPKRWEEFQSRYHRELDAQPDAVATLAALARKGVVTLLYGAKDEAFNNAQALRNYLLAARKRATRKTAR